MRGELARLKKNAESMPATQQEMIRLQEDVAVNNAQYTAMLNNVQQLRVVRAGEVGNVRVVDFAQVEPIQSKPKKLNILVCSMAASFMVGVLMVFMLRMMRNGVRSSQELEHATDVSVFAKIPESKNRILRDKRRKLTLVESSPNDQASEAFRTLQTALDFSLEAGQKVVMTCGLVPGVGKSFVAKNLAIKGKGSVTIEGGYFSLTATNGDGIKSDEGEDENTTTDNKGIVVITGGEFDINAGDDGIQAFNYIFIADSSSIPLITINSKGKGIATDNRIYMNGGITNVTSADDGLHSNLNIYINGGLTTISAGDDGIHADSTLRISDGAINITKAIEGIEAFYIRAEGGMTATVASDDAWNAAGGSADAGTSSGSQWGGRGGPGGMTSSSKGYIIISGGYHYLYTAGNDIDVLDANGTATMSGGVLLLEIGSSGGNMMFAPSQGGNQGGSSSGSCSTNMAGGLIDTDSGFSITGGVLLGFGSRTEEYPKCSATSYTAGTAYGTSSAAFKPSGSGSMIIYGGEVSSVSQVDVSDMTEITLPNGMTYYEK